MIPEKYSDSTNASIDPNARLKRKTTFSTKVKYVLSMAGSLKVLVYCIVGHS